jgi:hypothetical protein
MRKKKIEKIRELASTNKCTFTTEERQFIDEHHIDMDTEIVCITNPVESDYRITKSLGEKLPHILRFLFFESSKTENKNSYGNI